MYKDLKGKVAVITGASSGLGLVIAERLAKEGTFVVVNYYKDKENADKLVRSIEKKGGRAIAVQADIGNEQDVLRLVEKTIKTFGGFDIWINNAGRQKQVPFIDLTLEQWNAVLNTNLTGVFLGARQAIRHFVATDKKGIIINMSSVHQKIPRPQYADYAASKGAVNMLTKTLALEYAHKGIRINSIAPGAIFTPINAEFDDPKKLKETLEKIPMAEIGQPEYIANVTAWLCSSESSYVTGTTIFADGGLTLYPSFNHKSQ